jgi:peptide/nickel transport system substrate-binding protein
MNKALKGAICVGLCCTILTTVGCSKKSSGDSLSETRPLAVAIGALDGNFNPFTYTAQYDGEIAGMTQVSLMTADADGNVAYGDDQPTVAKDYTKTYYSTATGTGTKVSQTEADNGATVGRTEYEILIKNGIKYSDGVDLTIKDVLFNLYVYLDPAYSGSTTIYSTDIQGLKAYRAQDPDLADDSDASYDNFSSEAQQRITDLYNWSNEPTKYTLSKKGEDDLATVKKLFLEEATSDWTTISTSWEESYKDSYNFTETWQAYLFNEGIIEVQTQINSNGSYEQLKDADGKYYTTLDPNQSGAFLGTVADQEIIDTINDASTDAKVATYMAANPGVSEADAKEELQKEAAIQIVYDNYTDDSNIKYVVSYWATANDALEQFTAEARTEYYNSVKQSNNGELLVKSISGITTYKTSTFNGVTLDGEYDVLKIVINGIDPKAVWNFCFAVAPMHYYSDTAHTNAANTVDSFGVEFGDSDWFTNTLQAVNKNGLPVGAGAYMASNNQGNATSNRSEFKYNNIVYFMRNENYTTLGSGVENAKIKYLQYKVTSDDLILSKLEKGELDIGSPSATSSNLQEVKDNSSTLGYATYRTGGYGYVGINPKYVPDVEVRQAIMKAMDTNLTISFYGKNLAEIIYRPMSKTSWAYPTDATEYESTAYTSTDSEITALVESAGYTKGSDGIYAKGSTKLKLTFTIAGDSTNHPAYEMFTRAASRLNKLGFQITVKTDIQALKSLSNGTLAVWAAAWSSSIDPDMYQIYHKDSKATSVNNWNYSNILNNPTDWTYEYNIISELSDLIDEAREMDSQTRRSAIYSECLDLIMDMAVELPTYQRSDMPVYNKTIIDKNTLVQNPSYNLGLFDEIWKIDYIK